MKESVINVYRGAITIAVAVLILCFITCGCDNNANSMYGFWIFETVGKHEVLLSTIAIFGIYHLLKRFGQALLEEPFKPCEAAAQILLSFFFTAYSLMGKYFDLKTDLGFGQLTEHWYSKISILLAFLGGMVLFLLVFRTIWHLSGSIFGGGVEMIFAAPVFSASLAGTAFGIAHCC